MRLARLQTEAVSVQDKISSQLIKIRDIPLYRQPGLQISETIRQVLFARLPTQSVLYFIIRTDSEAQN